MTAGSGQAQTPGAHMFRRVFSHICSPSQSAFYLLEAAGAAIPTLSWAHDGQDV